MILLSTNKNNKYSTVKIYLLLVLFLSLLLINHGYHMTILSISLVLATFFIFKFNSVKISIIYLLFFYFLIFWSTYVFSGFDLDLKMYLATSLYIIVIFLFWSTLKNYTNFEIIVSLRYLIIFFLIIILIQHIVYFLTNYYLDFHKIVTLGNYESRSYDALFQKFNLTRATVFFVEPSNYSAIITYMSVLYYFFNKKFDKYFYIGLFASSLSLSYASIVINTIITLISIFNKKLTYKMIIKLMIVFLLIFMMLFIIYNRIYSDVQYDAIASRIKIFILINSFSLEEYLFGFGILSFIEPLNINDILVTNSIIRDSGVWINIFFSTGIIGTLIFVFYIKKLSENYIEFLLIFISLNYKMDYLQPIFWIFIIGLIYAKNRKH